MANDVEFEVREANPNEAAALGRLGAALAREHHAMDPDRFMSVGDEGYGQWLRREIQNPQAVVLVAIRARRIVGYIYGRIEETDWNTLREACGVGIDAIVEPAARGRGIGRRLVEELVHRLCAKGAPRVVISVAEKNPSAQRVFEKLGFRRTMVEMTRECSTRRPPPRE